MMEFKRSRSRQSLRFAMVAVGMATAMIANAGNVISRAPALDSSGLHLQRLNVNNLRSEVFVQLNEQSVAELNINSMRQTGAFASSAAQKAQAQRVTAQQQSIRSTLESMGATILSAHRVGANGLRISIAANQVHALSSIQGVKSVGKVVKYVPDNIDSVPWIGAPAVWNSLGVKGKGIKVGIIDTGIDYDHANLGGSGSVTDFDNNDPNVVEPGSFPTAKVVGGYDFAGADYDADVAGSIAVPDADPIDHSGHGSHVAGTVAGIGVPGSIGPGVAPEASLYAIKVFGDNGGSTNLVSEGIEWAMDPNGDGDMSDHLDVINMSLGSSFGDPNDPSAISASNAADLGIIVVASAGNSGPIPYVTGSPAVASAAISVAAASPGGRLYSKVQVTAPASVAGTYRNLEGAGPVQLVQISAVTGSLVPTVPADGCGAITNASSVAGNVALVVRGTCGFIVKYQQAQAAGAKAIVVYNDGTSSSRLDPIVMGGLDGTVTIPGVMIGYKDGKLLSQTSGVAVTLSAAPDPTQDDRLADFSSQGPGLPDSSFKPDLTAPGVSIVSTGMGTGTGSANFSGTSMAAPHVAGAAALLRQLHPGFNQSVIKALLQNSTVNANSSYDTKLSRQGVGVVRVDKAAALSSYASPGGVSFGRINPISAVSKSQTVTLAGLSSGTRVFTSSLVENHTMPGVQVICPSAVTVRGLRSSNARITMKFDPQVAADAGVVDYAVMSQTEVDGWCVFSDGKDELRVGYLAVVDPASNMSVTSNIRKHKAFVSNSGPAVGWAEAFTLAQIGGLQTTPNVSSIHAVGFRRADPQVFGANVLELGVDLDNPFANISKMIFDWLIDTNNDGVPDVEVIAADYSLLSSTGTLGTYVSAQFDLVHGGGFLDWQVITWDYNDNTAILPFTLQSDGGLLPEKFNYELHVIDSGDGSEDVQQGSVDLSNEVVPDLNSFGLASKEKAEVNMNGVGVTLWLFQNNRAQHQAGYSRSFD